MADFFKMATKIQENAVLSIFSVNFVQIWLKSTKFCTKLAWDVAFEM